MELRERTGACWVAPGDLIELAVPMRAWASGDSRGSNGPIIGPGLMGLVVQAWRVGGQFRIQVLVDDHLWILSSPERALGTNWRLLRRGSAHGGSQEGLIRGMDNTTSHPIEDPGG